MLDLTAIKKRLAEATVDTALAWGYESCGEKGDGSNVIGVLFHPDDENAESPLLGRCDPIYDEETDEFRDYYQYELIAEVEHRTRSAGAVAEFISHAPTDIFALLAEVECLRKSLQDISNDDQGQDAYGYKDPGLALDRVQRIALRAITA